MSTTTARYVDARHGDDANDGLTPETAKATLESASAALAGNAGTVHLGAGTYSAPLNLPRGTRIVGFRP